MSIVERNRENGKNGGRPKNEEENPKKPKKPNGIFGNPNNPKQHDSDSDSDSDNDNVLNNIFSNQKNIESTHEEKFDENFLNFQEWLNENCPKVSKIEKQLTQKQFLKFKEKYESKEIMDTLERIENRKDLVKKYSDLNRTLKNWLKNNHKNT
jgi:DNA repair ATPase RecN